MNADVAVSLGSVLANQFRGFAYPSARVRSWDSTSRNRSNSLTVPQAKRANLMSRRALKEIVPGRNTADTLCHGKRLYLQGEHTAC
jgi:hypothetical protein